MLDTYFEWTIEESREEEFRALWNRATAAYLEQGSLGSSLWKSDSGGLCAFALWPDRDTRDRAYAAQRSLDPSQPMAKLAEIIHKVDLDLLDMHWQRGALDG